jgi:hypothetical protein
MFSEGRKLTDSLRKMTGRKKGRRKPSHEHVECKLRARHDTLSSGTEHQDWNYVTIMPRF